jgi:hypothetical protein
MKIAPKRNRRFIVAFLGIILTNGLHAQKLLLESGSAPTYSIIGRSPLTAQSTSNPFYVQQKSLLLGTSSFVEQSGYESPRLLPADYYQKNIGIMCKMEWSFEKNTHLPLRFRLGSLDYVNHLEGK